MLFFLRMGFLRGSAFFLAAIWQRRSIGPWNLSEQRVPKFSRVIPLESVESSMLRGTQVITGQEAAKFTAAIESLRDILLDKGYQEIIIPSIWEQETFDKKAAGSPVLDQMWRFKDKGERDVCLIPEVTGIIQELYRDQWEKSLPKPIRLFYVSRCYRYERPQLGRYREFTQFGIEMLGKHDKEEVIELLKRCLVTFGLDYRFVPSVKRGLTYYVEDGFEVECDTLGAQKQVAGGGSYAEGIGWAIGIDRLMLALNPTNNTEKTNCEICPTCNQKTYRKVTATVGKDYMYCGNCDGN